ncbi:MAG: PEFG-CTERM sorting domain-containing protein [Nitrosopumilus sp.]|uniref:PEFG-CTERM sorting domain-containing protein n=1 Tax=Nitrosopumilus sp. TaxID=2024843 RepID=UPI00246A747E|nr:PEFG-CTERM sorting domain-containing protein [Nitrosopumilus sp.]MDH5430341.1 PEFG-CTERM sorting domain-containing protein [Nitrosopumilus sp.]MDH5665026.1 PEFG-CTERM sorting domain-containing protein [Nitrosopumilus sp.]
MNNAFLFFVIVSLLIIPSTAEIFAQTEYEIKIPSGASDPNAPFFWSEKSSGTTTGEITVYPGDSVTWHNADTAFHTITSVSASSIETGNFEVDGIFDSGFFTAGKSYTRQFNDLGDFYYFCSIHPYMNGVVHVIKNPGSVKTLDGVASGYSDDGLGFKIKYILDTDLQNTVHVNPDEKTLTFTISGYTENEQLTLILPIKLIENPNTVWVDGDMTDFKMEDTATGKKLNIPITPNSKEIKIMGAKVIPEFGSITLLILVISIVSVLGLTQRSKIRFL